MANGATAQRRSSVRHVDPMCAGRRKVCARIASVNVYQARSSKALAYQDNGTRAPRDVVHESFQDSYRLASDIPRARSRCVQKAQPSFVECVIQSLASSYSITRTVCDSNCEASQSEHCFWVFWIAGGKNHKMSACEPISRLKASKAAA